MHPTSLIMPDRDKRVRTQPHRRATSAGPLVECCLFVCTYNNPASARRLQRKNLYSAVRHYCWPFLPPVSVEPLAIGHFGGSVEPAFDFNRSTNRSLLPMAFPW